MQKCENSTPNTDITNDSLCNSCTSASRKNDNDKNNDGTETVTNTEINSVITNDEGSKGKAAEAEADADANSANSNSSNNGISSGNSKSNYMETKILKHPDENENKMIGNNVEYDGENPNGTRERQQQKCGNLVPIANN